MTIRIVADSTCDLPKALVEKHRITVVPIFINMGEKTYLDGIDLSRQEFYARLPEFKPAPTTAAPGPEVFRQVYERLASEGATEILSIHVSAKLSAVLDMATQAAGARGAVPVTVFDSRQLSLGTGFQVLAAAQAAAEGRSMGALLSMLEDQVSRTRVYAVLDTLEFLRRSGRMNFAISFLGTLLQIKPFMKMYNGEPTAERIRTHDRAMKRLVELLREASPLEKLAVLHANAAEGARALLEQVRPMLPGGEVMVEEINPAIGCHVGPGVIGLACISSR